MRTAMMVMAMILLARSSAAGIKTQIVEYTHGDTTLVGYLAYDDKVATEKTPRPGVVVCPEWWGNDDYAHKRAEQLAKELDKARAEHAALLQKLQELEKERGAGKDKSADGTLVVPLRHAKAQDALEVLKKVAPEIKAVVDPRTNSLVLRIPPETAAAI